MSDLFREIDSEVRRDQIKAAWERYGVYVLIGAVLIIAGVAGYRFFEYWQHRAASEAGANFTQALALAEEGKVEEARKAFAKISEDGTDGYAALARFQLAADSAKAGDKGKAIQTYEQLSASSSLDTVLRDYARVQAATLMIDDKPYTDMQQRLGSVAGEKGPYRFSARELLGLSAYKSGNMAEAEKQFSGLLGDAGAPQNMRNRAEIMLSLIVASTAGKPEAGTPSAAGAPAAQAPVPAPQGAAQ